MSISKKLDETLGNLDLTAAAQEARDAVISKSLSNLKEKMSGLDIEIERQEKEVVQEAPKPRYEGTELADLARGVYRDNIKSRDRKDKIDNVEKADPATKGDQPNTMASRANLKALSRSLAGMRSSGNEGKTSETGPNGVGNVGKLSPTDSNGIGNVTNNFNNYYALTTDMTLEEYEKYVHNIFEGEDCGCKEEDRKDAMPKGDVGHEIHKKAVQQYNKQNPSKKVKEDVVHELEQRLVTMGSTDWIVVDQLLREFARELDVAPRTLSREFKSVHGLYPDKWIKEHLEVEICGYMPLEEAARLNKVGKVYEVTFMFRGGTNRLKFFWPSPGDATKEDMQREVEKFWPKARLIAFYPTIDNEQQCNYMVMTPPMTENYHFMQLEDWDYMSEENTSILQQIYAEEGEPVGPPTRNEDGSYRVVIEDHDTGEHRTVCFDESMYGLGKAGGADAQHDNRYRQTKVRTAEYDKANKHANDQKRSEQQAYKKTLST